MVMVQSLLTAASDFFLGARTHWLRLERRLRLTIAYLGSCSAMSRMGGSPCMYSRWTTLWLHLCSVLCQALTDLYCH